MAHTIYDNFVLSNKIEDKLITALDVNNYMTIDNSLAQEPGMQKVIHTYVYSTASVAEDLGMGEDNTGSLDVSFSSASYTVQTTQAKFIYHDEEEMTDDQIVDVGIKGLADNLTNDLTTKAIAEFGKATSTATISSTGITYANVVDAIATYPYEDESGLFLLINPSMLASLRKNLEDNLKYVEANVRTGYIGTVCGVPVIVSKAVPAKTAYLATKEAVTCFVKKGSEVEQSRDIGTRTNTVVARKVMVVALTDNRRIVKMVQA